jgi:hypothetical protein
MVGTAANDDGNFCVSGCRDSRAENSCELLAHSVVFQIAAVSEAAQRGLSTAHCIELAIPSALLRYR